MSSEYSTSEYNSDYSSTASGLQTTIDISNLHFESQDLQSKIHLATHDDDEFEEVRAAAIEKLYAQSNNLTVIPPNIATLSQLTVLDFGCNNLTFVDDLILSLKHLTKLVLKHNNIDNEGLPKDLGKMQSLRELNLSGNRLKKFPPQIIEMTNIRYLYIGGNHIQAVPNEIGRLQA